MLDGNSAITIRDVTIENPSDIGIRLLGSNNTGVLVQDTTITGGPALMLDGIQISGGGNGITVRNTTITDPGQTGISIDSTSNIVNLDGVTIAALNLQSTGLSMTGGQTVTMNNTTFTGPLFSDVIVINGAGNLLSGSDNVFDGAFTGQFCNVTGVQNGFFSFDVAPQPTCP